jgi:isopropylmalate/homocitrate/citramalate synthase
MKSYTDKYWITELNFLPETTKDFALPQKAEIYDVTLREIDQTPGTVLRYEEKLEMAKELDSLGVNYVEIFPVVSKDDARALTDIKKQGYKFKTSGLARLVKADIDCVAECNADYVQIEGPGNMAMTKLSFGITDENAMIKSWIDNIKYAKSLGLKIAVVPWDMGKADIKLQERLYKEIAAEGVEQLAWADTYGFTTPWAVFYIIKKMREWTQDAFKIGCHFHNDYGLATANTMATFAAGGQFAHCALNSIGERAGNASLDEIVMMLEVLLGVKTDIDLSRLYPVSKKLESISNTKIAPTKPVIGERMYKMGSGLFIDWMQKIDKNGEDLDLIRAFDPALIGHPPSEIVYGKGVGKNMVKGLIEQLGYTPDKDAIHIVLEKIKAEALIRKDLLSEDVIKDIVNQCMQK